MAEPGLFAQSRVWLFSNNTLDERSLRLRVGGEDVSLQRKPFEVLLHLLNHAGEVVTKEELFAAVWPGRILSESVLSKSVHEIRTALRDQSQELIRTVHGHGYRLTSPVTIETHSSRDASSHLNLKADSGIPHRRGWWLRKHLESGRGGEIWLGQHAETRELRVFKFASKPEHVTALKREITLYRHLKNALGERSPATKILEWNMEEPPYFVETEYLPLGSLSDWATERALPQIPLQTRLEIAASIVDALALAHSVGVIHKDLKPANIFLTNTSETSSPGIRLSNFGSGVLLDVARQGQDALSGAAQSENGLALYQSPEAIAGQPATVKGDIYAAGIILFQLSVGDLRRTLAPGWELEIRDEELRDDIATAAASNAEYRLGDAALLALRIRTVEERRRQRIQKNEALEALARERFEAEQVKRRLRKVGSIAAWACGTGIALALGLGLSVYEYQQAVTARDEANAISRFMTHDLLSLASPLLGPTSEHSLKAVLDRAARRVDTQLAPYPNAIAQVKLALGWTYGLTEGVNQGVRFFEEAATLSENTNGRHSLRTMRILDDLAYWYALNPKKRKEALALLDEIGREYERVLPNTHLYVVSHKRIKGNVLLQVGRIDEAISTLRAAAESDVGLLDEALSLTDSEDDPKCLAAWELPTALLMASRYQEAAVAANNAIRVLPQSKPLRDGLEFLLAETEFALGRAALELGDYKTAGAALKSAERRTQQTLGHDHYLTRLVRGQMAVVHLEEGALGEAQSALEREILNCTDANCVRFAKPTLLLQLGRSYRIAGKPRDALRYLSEAAERFSTNEGPDDARTVAALSELASLHVVLGNKQEARATLNMVPTQAISSLPDKHTSAAMFEHARGQFLSKFENAQEARRALEYALQIYELRHGHDHWRTRQVRNDLAALGTPDT